MSTITRHTADRLAHAAVPRPKVGYRRALAPLAVPALAVNACAPRGMRATGSWTTAIRKSMTAPSFHDRWPLCSTT